jgi:hypothetical protein
MLYCNNGQQKMVVPWDSPLLTLPREAYTSPLITQPSPSRHASPSRGLLPSRDGRASSSPSLSHRASSRLRSRPLPSPKHTQTPPPASFFVDTATREKLRLDGLAKERRGTGGHRSAREGEVGESRSADAGESSGGRTRPPSVRVESPASAIGSAREQLEVIGGFRSRAGWFEDAALESPRDDDQEHIPRRQPVEPTVTTPEATSGDSRQGERGSRQGSREIVKMELSTVTSSDSSVCSGGGATSASRKDARSRIASFFS